MVLSKGGDEEHADDDEDDVWRACCWCCRALCGVTNMCQWSRRVAPALHVEAPGSNRHEVAKRKWANIPLATTRTTRNNWCLGSVCEHGARVDGDNGDSRSGIAHSVFQSRDLSLIHI